MNRPIGSWSFHGQTNEYKIEDGWIHYFHSGVGWCSSMYPEEYLENFSHILTPEDDLARRIAGLDTQADLG